ncbi:hypothetical protein BURPS406E_B0621 [Burkholderia pseudomallei 406e]|nr:hypothetical protein BOC43_24395 [Burkholderia pseudomallei]EDO83369.1 hypothetical protein BURPS406E_B0621 [Burkholderia pseudomallei 406e]EDO91388.1 hypothetical protein BURPSPAST_Z0621 [Burkholderia pseudomallei Pasteur 52237]EDU09688.1 hypothetical protein BURPS1655_K1054 [Burkholderia pseudomallei 1655]
MRAVPGPRRREPDGRHEGGGRPRRKRAGGAPQKRANIAQDRGRAALGRPRRPRSRRRGERAGRTHQPSNRAAFGRSRHR